VCLQITLKLAVCLLCLGVSVSAGTLEWPANLVSLSPGKSSQLLPLPPNGEDSAELVTESSAGAVSAASAEQQLEAQSDVQSESSGSDSLDASRGLPVSVPLPLLVASRSGLRTVLTIQEPALARVGNLVEHVPSSISHQSQTVVHDHRRLVTPIVAPAVRTTQVVRQQSPLVWSVSSDPRVVLLRH
ncbi:hypothetical protein KR222_007065, partial [Zaprionus bogoriensis]